MYYVLLDSELPPAGDVNNGNTGNAGNTGNTGNTGTTQTSFAYDKVIASGVIANAEGANVRQESNGTVVATLEKGTTVLITEYKTVENTKWANTEKGWVLMERIALDGVVSGVIEKGTNIRKGPGTEFEATPAAEAKEVKIVAQITVSGEKWGKVDGKNEWILMLSFKAGEKLPVEGAGTASGTTNSEAEVEETTESTETTETAEVVEETTEATASTEAGSLEWAN